MKKFASIFITSFLALMAYAEAKQALIVVFSLPKKSKAKMQDQR